jgi:hypothetical protein
MRVNSSTAAVFSAPPPRKATSAEGFKIETTLTRGDKEIIEKISPLREEQNGVQQINKLATLIALERSSGNLKGEIDQNYAVELKNRMGASKSDAVSADLLDKLLFFVGKKG